MGYLSYVLVLTVSVCWVLTPLMLGDEVSSPQVIAPHCSPKCGNITIPYPFGIEDGCYFDEHSNKTTQQLFKINCTSDSSTPTPIPIPIPILGENIQVVNISIQGGELRIYTNTISYRCHSYNNQSNNQSRRSGFVQGPKWSSVNLARFTLSSTKNVLVAIGCDTYAWFKGVRNSTSYSTGCMAQCVQTTDAMDDECSGIGCCQASIPSGTINVNVSTHTFNNQTFVYDFNPCSAAFVVAKDAFKFYRDSLRNELNYYRELKLPSVLSWTIGQQNCSLAKANGEGEGEGEGESYLCKENSECYDPVNELGYRCKCKDGYSGNPYLPQGCKDVDECMGAHDCDKPTYCINIDGGHYCKCPKGYHGKGTKTDPCISSRKAWLTPVLASAGVGGIIVVIFLVSFWFYLQHGNMKLQKMRETFFLQNGGHLLQQKLSRRDVSVGYTVQMFAIEELKKATNNYSENSIIGRGGFGMVYKGILPNNQVVAIKRSLKVNSTQVEQFVNEVIALSQINNKNVVKLLGCCLEMEVPLLVYEYIRNGTLYDHLHDQQKVRLLTWDVRLRIAAEVAEVLSYLHTTITIPIIHRDIKSMNILLDENYIAKVSDFGASKLVPENEDQLTTMVQGTCGYLDPEYMQTGELTEKSDVYSFGVVLVELLTGQKAISFDKAEEERCLVIYFLRKLKEDCLFTILDENVLSEGDIELQIKEVANVARKCLKVKGEDRPTMKQVARELDDITGLCSHPLSKKRVVLEDQEESEYLLGETLGDNNSYSNSVAGGSSSSQSRVVQLVPLSDGR
ncbi:hypothetical protein SOVF_077080 [Spinacia oleracea]|uniref:Wall-associated receptor kinase 1 n=1 Tax=Spinacia oleracea TaxID=3562 RepID=A0ABM3QKY0_SPIOL|nr:wall-associated receptor kinase 1-like [Spinacia oleracea]KNA17768.1 hypothetical protein SOVF_077080 [Spinacia oleracea]